MRRNSSSVPDVRGYAPVPIVEWIGGVFDGEDPIVSLVNHDPLFMIDFRYGQSLFQ